MKKFVVPLLALGFAGAVFAAPTVEASDKGKSAVTSSHRTRPCPKVSVAAMTKIAPASPRNDDAAFGNDFYNQHPSGGG